MEIIITSILVVAGVFVGFKLLGVAKKCEEYIDLRIEKATNDVKLDIREDSQKKKEKLKSKYSKTGLMSLDEALELGDIEIKLSNQ